MVKLSELNIKSIRKEGNWSTQDLYISGIETNSSKIKGGEIFFALEGSYSTFRKGDLWQLFEWS